MAYLLLLPADLRVGSDLRVDGTGSGAAGTLRTRDTSLLPPNTAMIATSAIAPTPPATSAPVLMASFFSSGIHRPVFGSRELPSSHGFGEAGGGVTTATRTGAAEPDHHVGRG